MPIKRRIVAVFLVLMFLLPSIGLTAFASVGESTGWQVEQKPTKTQIVPQVGKGFDNNPGALKYAKALVAGTSAADVVEFVYLDQTILAVGEEAHIALGLVDESAVITSAKLELLWNDTNERVFFDHSMVVDNTVLFSFHFSSNAETGAYRIATISCVIEEINDELVIDFLNEDVSYEYYCFEVVTAQLKEALGQADDTIELLALTIDKEGNLQSYNPVESTIGTADLKGTSELNVASLSSTIMSLSVASTPVQTAVSTQSLSDDDHLIIALDPGHGYNPTTKQGDPGAVVYDKTGEVVLYREDAFDWKIAVACAEELSTYASISVYFTRSQYENPSVQERVDRAVAAGADVFISIHNNSALNNADANGAEVWYPRTGTYNSDLAAIGSQLAAQIMPLLEALGLENRGAKESPILPDWTYPDESEGDYYGVIRYSRLAGILGIIIEHAFLSNEQDLAFLAKDSNLVLLGVADAKAIASYYGLVKDATVQSSARVGVRAHITNLGWQTTVYDQKIAGSTGKNLGLQAFQIDLQNSTRAGSGIEYRSYVDGSWQKWVSNGQTSGTTGQNKPVQAVQILLTGTATKNFDVYYRVHVSELGWLGWTYNGQRAGTIGYDYQIEALQVTVVPKGTSAPAGTGLLAYYQSGGVINSGGGMTLTYQAHVAEIGWQLFVGEGKMAGTTGKALAMEALILDIFDQEYSGGITYNAHVADIGWQGWKTVGQTVGTTGRALQMEAIRIQLTGELADHYDISYRVHVADLGWLGWVKNGETAGTTGQVRSLQAIEIKLVKNDSARSLSSQVVESIAHLANLGWQNPTISNSIIGTTGKALAMEAIILELPNQLYSGGIRYNAHVSNIGWQGWKTTGQTAGTTGRALQMEAIRIELTGTMAQRYDIYYRAHIGTYGWLGWAKNGENAGSTGLAIQLEALQITLIPKDGAAPGATGNVFVTTTQNPIMGISQTVVAQMVKYYNNSGFTYPSSIYTQYGASTITQFCTILLAEAKAEGVRAEVVFAQAMIETGWLQFGGDVQAAQCNFCGLGAIGGGAPGESFNIFGTDSVRMGLRAQIQHLKAYASTDALNQTLVDPRFNYVARGRAPYVEDLGGTWAADKQYGTKLMAVVASLLVS